MVIDHLGRKQPLLGLPGHMRCSGRAGFGGQALGRKIQLGVRLRRPEGKGSMVFLAAAHFSYYLSQFSCKQVAYWQGMALAGNLPYPALVLLVLRICPESQKLVSRGGPYPFEVLGLVRCMILSRSL